MSAAYTGLTWDHPRGFAALHAAAQHGGLVDWYMQPLEGFESAPVAELCARYDLIVLDHPHLGEALETDCLQPLEDLFTAVELQRIAAASVGPSYASYHLGGHQWALPLDAASQVMALRADLLPGATSQTWDEVITLAEEGTRVALSLAGPHALLSFLSIAVALEPDCELSNGDNWISRPAAQEAWRILSALARRALPSTFSLNPIRLLEAMTRGNEIALCPLVYGYVNYADPSLPKPLTFIDAPAAEHGGPPGSIIGGTGIAVSRRCRASKALRAHLLWLLDEDTQRHFIPVHAGQPSATSSWRDTELNRAWGGFYANTLNTLRHAHIRPRHDGFIAFQARGSAWLREALVSGHGAVPTLDRLDALFRNSHRQRSAS